MTGAAGGIGTSLRKLLPPIYPDLVLSDLKAPADLGAHEKFKAADLADLTQVEALCEAMLRTASPPGHECLPPREGNDSRRGPVRNS